MLFFCAIQTRDRLDHLQQSPSMLEVGKKYALYLARKDRHSDNLEVVFFMFLSFYNEFVVWCFYLQR